MKTVISLLACAWCLSAQVTATINDLPDGGQEVRIRNDSKLALAAYALSIKLTPANFSGGGPRIANFYDGPRYRDAEIDPDARALPAGGDSIVMGGPMPDPNSLALPIRTPITIPKFESVAIAGILEDGSTTGDSLLLNHLLMRRRSMLLAVETALEALDDAERAGASRYQLIVRFKKMTESLHRWYLGPDQQIGLRVYQPILGSLVNMQGAREGARNPLAAFLDDTTAALRRQRIRLSESQPSLAMLH